MELEEKVRLMLRAAWVAAILPILFASIPSPLFRSLRRLVLGFANRGKTCTTQNFTVPQRFFLHFYVVAVVWTTLLLLMTWFCACEMGPPHDVLLPDSTVASHLTRTSPVERRYILWRTVLLLLLMEVQVWRRLYETVCVFNYGESARMHILGYFTGLFFYTAAPLSLCSSCAPELVNFAAQYVTDSPFGGQGEKPTFEFDWFGYANTLTKFAWFQWVGSALFFWGWMHQYNCHAILGSLRKHKAQPGGYVIPRGDWFESVSCAHYLAEIVIYAGLLIASGGSEPTIWLLFGFVVVNLVFAAAETHRWYLQKFENYPPTRHAIIPFVY